MSRALGQMFPGYEVTGGTLVEAALVTVLIGILAGIAPALRAKAIDVITALRATT